MLIVYIINIGLVSIAVMIHYEMLYRMSALIPFLTIKHRFRVIFGVIGALVAHVVEISVFSIGYYLMIRSGNFGTLIGEYTHSFSDCFYYSFVTYTSLGLGDISPTGDIRFTTGLESLTGLVLITWTASFMFIEMQRFWKIK